MARVTILDLGLGNLHSVAQAFERAGAHPTITSEAAEAAAAERLVVPGQGAFAEGAGDAIRAFLETGRPYLGICLGMQLLFERSDEAPGAAGLGAIAGEVRRFPADREDEAGRRLKVPHMGWSVVRGAHPLLEDGAWYYFVHSYYCVPDDPALTVGTADYGGPFCAALARGPLFACQFHPEKSQRRGARLLTRFLEI